MTEYDKQYENRRETEKGERQYATFFNKIENLNLDMIHADPENKRTMNGTDIQALADSIAVHGLQTPIIVREYAGGSTYTVVSGHRRYAAVKALGWTTIPAIVIRHYAGIDSFDGQTEKCLSNWSRKTPEEILHEVTLAHEAWTFMPTYRREAITAQMRATWEARQAGNPMYIADPAGYTADYWRPALEWIRITTGLDKSNATIRRYLDKIGGTDPTPSAPAVSDPEDKETAEKQHEAAIAEEKLKVTEKKAVKAIKKAYDLIDSYKLLHGSLSPEIIAEIEDLYLLVTTG